jgi:ABC-2 type transport system ATP-binding protein
VIEVRESVRQLGKDHTVLFSTHILSEAEQVCDRVVIINEGRIVAQGKPDELRHQLQPGAHLFVQVSGGEPDDLLHLLGQIPGVELVQPQMPGFSLRAQPGADIRAAVSEQIFQAGYTLLEMRPVAMTLEDIFLDIVKRGKH